MSGKYQNKEKKKCYHDNFLLKYATVSVVSYCNILESSFKLFYGQCPNCLNYNVLKVFAREIEIEQSLKILLCMVLGVEDISCFRLH